MKRNSWQATGVCGTLWSVIPDPGVVVSEIVRMVPVPGVGLPDVIRWVGVAVAVLGVILATPDGIAWSWLWVKNKRRSTWRSVRRVFRRGGQVVAGTASASGVGTMTGTADGYAWREWEEKASNHVKIDILHQQAELLLKQVIEVRAQTRRNAEELRKDICDAESRVVAQVHDLTLELRGERIQASHVNARGLGPVALGIILTGLPGELATIAPIGWLAIVVASLWTGLATPSWWRDYRHAMESSKE